MDTERQHWLVHMIEATSRAIDAVEDAGDPYHAALHANLVELHDRLRSELAALAPDA